MKPRLFATGFTVVLFILAVAVLSVYSQDDVTVVSDSIFGKRMRPSAVFHHDEHNEAAEIEECTACHHVYEDGQLVEDESSEDMECSECHADDGRGYPMEVVNIYHTLCKGCHMEQKAGPVMCGECHLK
ncbi:MAG: cytochrome c3 family protein [Deltaproteobacteria bacterium]|nr:cytochrome c3 family protein [Deltaproteobacteria bacterium]